MGLDMYLTKETYIGGKYKHRGVSGKVELTVNGKQLNFDPKNLSHIVEEVGYWRKANQIHNWFVQNVQDGKDECQRAYVSRDKLKELYSLVSKALKNKDSNLLEPTSGFFFGSTSIDEYYWQDLEMTEEILEKILNEPNDSMTSYYYQSSW